LKLYKRASLYAVAKDIVSPKFPLNFVEL